MKVRKTVFGSESEKDLYKTLSTNWSQKFDLFPSLPFASIIDINDAVLSDKERNYLYKTSVDFTLCTKRGNPIVSLEFDGLCHGFSRNGTFVEVVRNIRDPNRKWKMDLKLRVANEVKFPLFIVSYDEKVPIGKDLTLTIVDGIIGQFLAHRYSQVVIEKRIREYLDLYENLPTDEKYEVVQQIVTDTEVEAEFKWDPIVIEASRLASIARRNGMGWKKMSVRYHHEPELPDYDSSDPFNVEVLEQRIKSIEKAERVGVTVSIVTQKGEFSETVWVRNLVGYGVSPTSLAENIAELILCKNLLSGAYYQN